MPSPLTPLPEGEGKNVENAGLHSLQEKQDNILWEALKQVDLYELIKNSKN
jgi:hypothetical protein